MDKDMDIDYVDYSIVELKLNTVKNILKDELQKLVMLIPKKFRDKFEKHAFIAGGCIYSLYNHQKPKDIDVFLTSTELAHELRDYFSSFNGLKNNNGVMIGKYRDNKLVITDNAITIGKYQIITRFVGQCEEVVSQFDFKHNMFYYYRDEIKTLSNISYLESRKLVYNEQRARDICGTIMRVNKFVKRGMTIDQEEMAKMLLKLHEKGFNEREVEILKSKSKSFES